MAASGRAPCNADQAGRRLRETQAAVWRRDWRAASGRQIGAGIATPQHLLADLARDLLNALGGAGPEFDFDLWESASDESRVDADRSELDADHDDARIVLAGLPSSSSGGFLGAV